MLSLNVDEIYDIGLSEVLCILFEMKKVKEIVGFEGDLKVFFEYLRILDEFYYDMLEELIVVYEVVKEKIDVKLL